LNLDGKLGEPETGVQSPEHAFGFADGIARKPNVHQCSMRDGGDGANRRNQSAAAQH
jgi:hypothetical protein